MMRNKLNLSVAADLIEEEYVKRDLPGEGLAALFHYLSHGDLKSYIDLPAIYNVYPELDKFEWAKLAYIQFKAFFEYEDGELSVFSIERDLFVHYIIPAMLSSDYAKGDITHEQIFLDYVSLVPEKVEIFVYDDDLAPELAKLPMNPEGRGSEVRKKAGAPEMDRGWLYFTAAAYMTLYHSKFGKNASDKEIMNFISGSGGLMGSLPDQISEVTLQRELAEMKRRRAAVVDLYQNKFGETI
jgi:hypothetical protein